MAGLASISLSVAVLFGSAPARAERLNAGFVALDMDADDRFSFVSGMVQGLAFAKLRSDQGDTRGADCIYGWFYDEDGTMDTILAAFAKFQDRDPAVVLSALIQRRCGA